MSENQYQKGFLIAEIGALEITVFQEVVKSVKFADSIPRGVSTPHRDLYDSLRQIDEYFKGIRTSFDLEIDAPGTPFQKKVWKALLNVTYGETASYKDIAAAVGNHKAVRAVGGANGRNPLAIIVPCHRIIGADGSLVGYGGGLWRKKWLLEHEKKVISSF